MASLFSRGSIIIVYLREPRERIWGMMTELAPVGVSMRGLDLDCFDEWLRAVAGGEEDGIGISSRFYPMARIERILMDEPTGSAPSLDARCKERTGRGLRDHLADRAEAGGRCATGEA
ncbi:MAG: hypothetical protein ACE5HU_01875 [Acidobacteriota bacterium]